MNAEVLSEITTTLQKSDAKVIVIIGAGASTEHGIPDLEHDEDFYRSFLPETVIRSQNHPFTFVDVALGSLNTPRPTLLRWWAILRDFVKERERVFNGLDEVDEGNEERESEGTSTYSIQRWIQSLTRRGQLLRCISLNIDSLELNFWTSRVEVKEVEANYKHIEGQVLQLHGDIYKIQCTSCGHREEWDDKWNMSFHRGYSFECVECLLYARRSSQPPGTFSIGHMQPAARFLPGILASNISEDQDFVLNEDAKHSQLEAVVIVGVQTLPARVYNFMSNVSENFAKKKTGKIYWCNKTAVDPVQVQIADHVLEITCLAMVKALRMEEDGLKNRRYYDLSSPRLTDVSATEEIRELNTQRYDEIQQRSKKGKSSFRKRKQSAMGSITRPTARNEVLTMKRVRGQDRAASDERRTDDLLLKFERLRTFRDHL